MSRLLSFALVLSLVLGGLLLLSAQAQTTFLETFDGQPTAPQPFVSPRWDVLVHQRDWETRNTMDSMAAKHGPDCGAPPATHIISNRVDAAFLCRDHVMTAINMPDYGALYLTPNHMLDFSAGEAVLRFDVSSEVAGNRDWIDFWITPYADALPMPLGEFIPSGYGVPRNAVQVEWSTNVQGATMFGLTVWRDFQDGAGPPGIPGSFTSIEQVLANNGLAPSAARRDTYELRISRTHLSWCAPALNHCWFDGAMPDLGWDKGIVQFGHHSYTPAKDGGTPGTWHWDNAQLSPAVPFTLIKPTGNPVEALVKDGTSQEIVFDAPAPAGSLLRFHALGTSIEVSLDGGGTWLAPAPLPSGNGPVSGNSTYSEAAFGIAVPAGMQSARFRASNYAERVWYARSFSIHSLTTGNGPAPTPTAPLPATSTPLLATSTPVGPTATPTSTPLPTATPWASPTSTLVPDGTVCRVQYEAGGWVTLYIGTLAGGQCIRP